jgi:hypothetical protein
MKTITSIKELIGLWPSVADFARDAGVGHGAAQQMRRRGSIAVEHWPAIISAADVRGFPEITVEKLMSLHIKKQESPSGASQSASAA